MVFDCQMNQKASAANFTPQEGGRLQALQAAGQPNGFILAPLRFQGPEPGSIHQEGNTMPIVYCDHSGSKRMVPDGFADLNELREWLALHPELLGLENEPRLALVQRNVALPGMEALDLLLAGSDGYLTVVKVWRPDERTLSRQIYAAVFEAVAGIASLGAAALDRNLDGALARALRGLVDDPQDDYEFNQGWQSCDAYLRAGKVRLTVASDRASAGQTQAFQFIKDHSDLDVRLLLLRKYASPDGAAVLVPEMAVYGAVSAAPERPAIPLAARPEFEAVIAAYARIADPGLEPQGEAARYRGVAPAGWPGGVHYEFCDEGGEIGVELHLESPELAELAEMLRTLAGRFAAILPSAIVRWEDGWSGGPGRLRVLVSAGASPLDVAGAMKLMIKETLAPIASALALKPLESLERPRPAGPVATVAPASEHPHQKIITVGDQNIVIELDRPAAKPQEARNGPDDPEWAVEMPAPPLPPLAAAPEARPNPLPGALGDRPPLAGAAEDPFDPPGIPEGLFPDQPAVKPYGVGDLAALAGFVEFIDENGRSSMISPLEISDLVAVPAVWEGYVSEAAVADSEMGPLKAETARHADPESGLGMPPGAALPPPDGDD